MASSHAHQIKYWQTECVMRSVNLVRKTLASETKLHQDVECSIVAVDKFIQATRDSGYNGTASAVSELVDNSIQAGATRIALSITAIASDVEKNIEVSVLDNGCGMNP